MPMPYNPNQNHSISLNNASSMTAAYRAANPAARIGGFFGRDVIMAILNQANCAGLKIYFGLDSSGEISLVVTGTESNLADQYQQGLAEFMEPDPGTSSIPNPLNT